ncbi:MAG: bifunctional heptose 7-phosphate kinase/heptose 1-phosphate adenyltransferase [Limisphaerales bacterium]
MNPDRFHQITSKYSRLRLAVVGDFCLDRYLEIDPTRRETSIETGLPVHNVVRVRSQPGGAGTILNNLVALGIGAIYPVGFAGEDGEGFELGRALSAKLSVRLDYFVQTEQRRTFTYCKPLVIEPGQPPAELNRLDSKNWTPTPPGVEAELKRAVEQVAERVDAIILLDQVDLPSTGVVTESMLDTVDAIARARPERLIIADSRRGLRDFPPVSYKMNCAELARVCNRAILEDLLTLERKAVALARINQRYVFVTLAERGLLGVKPSGAVERVPALPVRGEIDIVGAGDAVTANLAASLAAGAGLREALEIANAAASIVIHQLGTTGTASVRQIGELLAAG